MFRVVARSFGLMCCLLVVCGMLSMSPSGVSAATRTTPPVARANAPKVGLPYVGPLAWMSAVASSYGPGLYGRTTACGQVLQPTTIGVAHKTMACGTRLKFIGRSGQIVAATVIDRGPYVAGRTFDITEGTVKLMGYSSAIDFGVRTVSWDYN